jgi:glycosyltransferase involved in cell wall biosynthesis
VPYGLDLEDFAPRDQGGVRSLLGIPADARVALFVADGLDQRRKGFALLIEALNYCAGAVPGLMLVSLGHHLPQVNVSLPWMHLGSINNDRFLSMVYSAADVFVICSLQDNLPNTVLEAMACGTPVIGVGVGGVAEMVRNGLNGLAVPRADAVALSAAIQDLMGGTEKRRGMKAACRRIAIDEYPLELQARRYVQIYESLL